MPDRPVGLTIRTRLRPGIYWDASGAQRDCVILELIKLDGTHVRLSVLDARTREPILDPVEAIPIDASE